jgi:hypothetical protein
MDRDACLQKAAECREKAKADSARAEYWNDQATMWLQRAGKSPGDRAITHEVRDGRMVPKPDK